MGRKRFITIERLERIAIKAIQGGYAILDTDRVNGRPRRIVRLKLSMGCVNPGSFELHARISDVHTRRLPPMTIYGDTRCRKCEPCQKNRARFWTGRAMTEYGIWPTTIFGSFTLSMDQHYLLDSRARVRLATGADKHGEIKFKSGVDFDTLTPVQKFAEQSREFGFELTDYLKRLRKGDKTHDKPAVRYLLVAEAHDGERTDPRLRGRPHYHVLLHELRAGALVLPDEWVLKKYQTKSGWKDGLFVTDSAFLRKNWQLGFTKFQLAENARAASYLCKYLTKTLLVRVRASQGYGNGGLEKVGPLPTPFTESMDGSSIAC